MQSDEIRKQIRKDEERSHVTNTKRTDMTTGHHTKGASAWCK